MKFLTGKELEDEIYNMIFYAERELVILSPYINIEKYFKNDIFKTHLNNSNLHITIGFGKNEEDITKSLSKKDFEYFTQFPNISIIHIPKLHGKYYANEKKSIVTSINLVDYSFRNNIEFGVVGKKTWIEIDSFYKESKEKCAEIINNGKVIFVKRPKYHKKMFGLVKDFVGAEVEVDIFDDVINKKKSIDKVKISEFPKEKYVNIDSKKSRENRQYAFCIRCKERIELNINKPLCNSCYRVWAEWKDGYYSERYCIFCGKEKDRINYNYPSCYDCYKKK